MKIKQRNLHPASRVVGDPGGEESDRLTVM